jgi:hypothetical protein
MNRGEQNSDGKERKMNWKLPKKRWTLGLALLALGALVLAGCGGGSGSSSDPSTTANGSGAEGKGPGGFEISTEARACLKEKGAELPEFKGGEGGEPPRGGEKPEGGPPAGAGVPGGPGGEGFGKLKKAFEECGVETPGFKRGSAGEGGAPVESAVFRKQVKRYAACVRKNGYELAEPNLSGEGPVFKESESESAAFKKASAKCQSLLGAPRGGQGSQGENET